MKQCWRHLPAESRPLAETETNAPSGNGSSRGAPRRRYGAMVECRRNSFAWQFTKASEFYCASRIPGHSNDRQGHRLALTGTRGGVGASITRYTDHPSMARLVLLVALMLAPLLASAHGAHHAAEPEALATLDVEASGTVRAVVAAPSRCPGSKENCCCHDAACTPPSPPVAVDGRPVEAATPTPGTRRISRARSDALRAGAFVRYPPRGPPARS